MKRIEVAVLTEASENPGGMMMFLAKLTQRGHQIQTMDDLNWLYTSSLHPSAALVTKVARLPHGTIKRFSPITIAIVGASRRFLAQARTHQVGMNFVSASLQYSNYSGAAQFVVPYELLGHPEAEQLYKNSCEVSMQTYSTLAKCGMSGDTAGYVSPQGLRNILIIQANHQAWEYFIRLRSCNRNTTETQYVTLKIWEALLKTTDGEELFGRVGPDCMYGSCREGNMSCGEPMRNIDPTKFIEYKWPLLKGQDNG